MTRRTAPSAEPAWWLPAVRADEAGRGFAGPPAWARFCERVFARAATGDPVTPVVPVGRTVTERAAAEAHFAPVVAPFVAVAGLPAVSGPAADLTALLCRAVARTMVAELHRVLGGTGTAADAAAVVRETATSTGLRRLGARYPVLMRLLATRAAQHDTAVREILEHAATDRTALVERLLGADPGPVVAVDSGVGDTHHGGRSVSVVTFADGRRLVHKPRSLGVHLRLGEIAAVTGLDLGPVADVLDRGDHGWAVFVSPAPCDSAAAVARFHWRAGALLAVLHTLRATDLHCENLVAAGEYPVPVDLETVLHPDVDLDAAEPGDGDPARRVLEDSVLRTAMLPRHGAPGISGLGAGPSTRPRPETVTWVDAGLPTMRLIRRPGTDPAAANRPFLDGAPQDATDWSGAVVDGFRDGYDRLVEHRDELAAGPFAAIAATPSRVVLRNTATYARLLDEATHPHLLGAAAARDDLLRRLATHGDYPAAVVAAEVEQLWHGDVPGFEARPGRAGVFVPGGADPVVGTTGALHRHGLFRLSRGARERQARIVAAALTAASAAPAGAWRRPRSVGSPPWSAAARGTTGARGLDALTAAVSLADQLLADAVDDGRRCNWLTVCAPDTPDAVDDPGTVGGSVLPAGIDLGSGHLGVALFLAETARLSGGDRHRHYARRAVVDTTAMLDAISPEQASVVGPGAAAGLGGIAYGLHRLHRLLPGAGLDTGVDLALRLLAHSADVPDPGLAEGRAGGLLALLALAPHRPVAAGLVTSWAEALAAGDAAPAEGTRREVALALGRAGRVLGRPDLRAAATRLTGAADGAAVRVELDPAGFVTRRLLARLAERPSPHDSLAGGTAGVLDLLLGSVAAPDRAVTRLGDALVSRVGSRTLRYRPGLALPGLADGLAGIGWTLLRLHAYRSGVSPLPRVLTLEPGHEPAEPTELSALPALPALPAPHPAFLADPTTPFRTAVNRPTLTIHEGALT